MNGSLYPSELCIKVQKVKLAAQILHMPDLLNKFYISLMYTSLFDINSKLFAHKYFVPELSNQLSYSINYYLMLSFILGNIKPLTSASPPPLFAITTQGNETFLQEYYTNHYIWKFTDPQSHMFELGRLQYLSKCADYKRVNKIDDPGAAINSLKNNQCRLLGVYGKYANPLYSVLFKYAYVKNKH